MHHSLFGRDRPPPHACDCSHGGEYSSDKILVERIAAGDKLAMQVLFARHRTPVYRWLSGSSATRPWPKTC